MSNKNIKYSNAITKNTFKIMTIIILYKLHRYCVIYIKYCIHKY